MTRSNLLLDLGSLRREGLSPPLVVGVLGTNLWFGLLVLPMWHLYTLGSMTAAATVTVFGAVLPLIAGVALLALRRRGSEESLLVGFPALVFLALFLQPALAGPSVFSPGAIAIVGVSFGAYVIGVCWACHRSRVRQVEQTATPLEVSQKRYRKRWSWTLIVFAAILALFVIGMGHLSLPVTEEDGPGSGHKGRIIVMSAGALVLWCIAFFGILAPSLRRRRQRRLGVASRGAAVIWLLVVALAGAMLVLSSVE